MNRYSPPEWIKEGMRRLARKHIVVYEYKKRALKRRWKEQQHQRFDGLDEDASASGYEQAWTGSTRNKDHSRE